jgi:hypothetical protein
MKASLNDIVRNNTLSPARVANALDAGKVFVATGTDTYAVTVGLGIASYVLGDKYSVQIPNANTGTTPTLNVSTIGAINIKDNAGNNLAIGDLKALGIYEFVYDGTNFRVINIGGGGGAGVDDAISNGETARAPSQNAVFDALALKSPLASPTFTGTPAAPTATAGTNTTQIATTEFVQSAVVTNNVVHNLFMYNNFL